MAIAYSGVFGSASAANNATTCNFSINSVPANANGCIICCDGYYDGGAEEVPACVVGGEAATSRASQGDTDTQYSRIFTEFEATLATSYAVTNTWSTGQDEGMACGGLVFDGAEQDTVRASGAAQGSLGQPIQFTLTGLTVGDMVGVSVSDFNSSAHTAVNCTEIIDNLLNASGDTALFAGHHTADSTTETCGATGGDGRGSAALTSLIEATGGGGGINRGVLYQQYRRQFERCISRDEPFLLRGRRFEFAQGDVEVAWHVNLRGLCAVVCTDAAGTRLLIPLFWRKIKLPRIEMVIPKRAWERAGEAPLRMAA